MAYNRHAANEAAPELVAERDREEREEQLREEIPYEETREAEIERLWERYPEEMRTQQREDAEHRAHVQEIFGMSDREYAEYDAERTREIERETPELFDPDDPRAYIH